ncbi:MAG: hypothetical protein SF187_24645 [Deltaproteobacteria bacterium]|nr:hypothetical protein [Deltaproteobacteria bacterium]
MRLPLQACPVGEVHAPAPLHVDAGVNTAFAQVMPAHDPSFMPLATGVQVPLPHASQAPLHALLQHTPSGQNPDAHSAGPPHATPCFFLHWPLTQVLLLSLQGFCALQLLRQAPPLHENSPQLTGDGMEHTLAPLHVEAGVALLPEQEAPAHEPSFTPFGMGAQTPLAAPVSVLRHDSHAPVHALLQQNPSAHLSDPQSPFPPQAWPLGAPHCFVRELHLVPPRQSASVAQLPLQAEPLHTRLPEQVMAAGALHVPAPSHVDDPIS